MTDYRSRTIHHPIVSIIGLGYVGLPLATAFARSLKVIGFDADAGKINQLISRQLAVSSQQSETPTNSINSTNLVFTHDPVKIGQADFVIVCVPTPVTVSKEPDLSCVRSAAETIGQNMKNGATVILESTVYPGVTEEIIAPILEKESGFKCGKDFKIAYSPERINPGDEEHTLDKITKVVAGMDDETTDEVASLYSRVAATVFKARNIKTAEAAKVIENVQRDLNIALMNELAIIFDRMGICTSDVLAAAATKWNFHPYSPGLVGGHCIPVDPYYLVHKAKELGYHPQVILAGRAINDYMPGHVAEMTIKALNDVGKVIKGSKVLIMGLTYKENVADTRETPVRGIIKGLKAYRVDIYGCDPLLTDIESEFAIKPYDCQLPTVNCQLPTVDCVILAVAHGAFKDITLDNLKAIMNVNPILIDIRGFLDAEKAREKGFHYRTL